ncbi:MAG: CpsD/CapB family tyrosine-protein kinase [Phycisphaeraceae bacterium]|nr:CpsD/CapB family tyrosine-protein kinase [Phycisphaeraceae bacterium]
MGDVYDAMNRRPEPQTPTAPHDTDSTVFSDRQEPANLLDSSGDSAFLQNGTSQWEMPEVMETGGLPLEEVMPLAQARPGKPLHNQQPVHLRLSDAHGAATNNHPGPVTVPGGCVPNVASHRDRTGLVCEQYRQLRAQILAHSKDRKRQTHLFTSSEPREGKSLTVVNLGVVFAELANNRTLLIEADLRRPSFQKIFGRPFLIGLSHVLRGDIEDEAEAIHPTMYPNLHVMPAGEQKRDEAGELLAGSAMVRLLDRLKDRYEHILIDSPPVTHAADACVLGALCDETVLVVRLHRTPRKVARRSKQLLEAAGCTMAGSILVGAEQQKTQESREA